MFVDEANHIYIAMPMYNLIEYSDNYLDTSGSFWQFKRDEVPANNADLTIDKSKSFKYKAALVGKQEILLVKKFCKRQKNSCSIEVFKQLLEIIRNDINKLKVHLELNWI